MKDNALRFFKIFGSIYLFLNCIVCVVMVVFAAHAYMTSRWSPAFLVFLLPLIGVFSGYWMRNGKYGWWRTLVITASLAISAVILFTSIFISPKLEKIKQSKFEIIKKVKSLEPEIKKMFMALYVNDLKIVKQQLDKGINPNVTNDVGQTPLHVTQDPAILKMLISRGADVNAPDSDGRTPMFDKDVELLKVLIEAGADIHHRGNKGNTLLIWYSYSGYLKGVQYLVSLGVDVNAINTDGHTARDIAEEFSHFKLLEYLQSIGAKPGKQHSN